MLEEMLNNEFWVFGMVDTFFQPAKGYMEIVPRRDRETRICSKQKGVKELSNKLT